MATLPESSEFTSGIYQIETTDPVLGGVPNDATKAGLSNIPAMQLARRTRWLKDVIEAAGINTATGKEVTDLDAITTAGFYRATGAITGTPDATGSVAVIHVPGIAAANAYQVAFRIGSTTRAWLRRRNGGTWFAWVEILNETAKQTSAGDATAGALLTVGAFGLGARLTVADCNEPPGPGMYSILSGTSLNGPDPAGGTNYGLLHIAGPGSSATQIAGQANGDTLWFRTRDLSAAWGPWQSLRGTFQKSQTFSGADLTLEPRNAGRAYIYGSTGNINVTLPAFSACTNSDTFTLINTGPGTITVLCAGSDNIDYGVATAASFVVPPYCSLVVVKAEFTSLWHVIGPPAPQAPIAVAQNWQNVSGSRAHSTSYQNTTGRPIQVAIVGGSAVSVQASINGSSWVTVGSADKGCTFIVPADHYYRVNGSTTITTWAELR